MPRHLQRMWKEGGGWWTIAFNEHNKTNTLKNKVFALEQSSTYFMREFYVKNPLKGISRNCQKIKISNEREAKEIRQSSASFQDKKFRFLFLSKNSSPHNVFSFCILLCLCIYLTFPLDKCFLNIIKPSFHLRESPPYKNPKMYKIVHTISRGACLSSTLHKPPVEEQENCTRMREPQGLTLSDSFPISSKCLAHWHFKKENEREKWSLVDWVNGCNEQLVNLDAYYCPLDLFSKHFPFCQLSKVWFPNPAIFKSPSSYDSPLFTIHNTKHSVLAWW